MEGARKRVNIKKRNKNLLCQEDTIHGPPVHLKWRREITPVFLYDKTDDNIYPRSQHFM